MTTDLLTTPTTAIFPQLVEFAIANLKQQLQRDYEVAYPELREIVHLVLDEEEAHAWELSEFPHLLLPDLVESHIAQLNLPPAETRHEDVLVSHHFHQIEHPEAALAFCG